MKDIDIAIERRQYYDDDFNVEGCPECGEVLIAKGCTVMLAVRSESDEAEFMTNAVGSTFCQNCPIVVFDRERVEMAAKLGIKAKEKMMYSVIGFVNLDAVPESKRQMELGTDENPIPFISFLPSKNLKTVVTEKKTGRNEPCPCGSGKKYKKCCSR